MPMDLSRYPKDWKAIAIAVKKAANWKCQECGMDCCGERSPQARFVLTVHHADYNPENNHPENQGDRLWEDKSDRLYFTR